MEAADSLVHKAAQGPNQALTGPDIVPVRQVFPRKGLGEPLGEELSFSQGYTGREKPEALTSTQRSAMSEFSATPLTAQLGDTSSMRPRRTWR